MGSSTEIKDKRGQPPKIIFRPPNQNPNPPLEAATQRILARVIRQDGK
ncbi:MAG: hypothetical protein V1858_01075 [Candidatus Gottesmanbacteria bacterium]